MGLASLAWASFATPMVPFAPPWLHRLAAGLWIANIVMFGLFTIMYGARWLFFFDTARRIFRNSIVSMFLGAIPMGLATIINGFIVFGEPRLGAVAVHVADALWWIDAVLALACGWLVPYMMFTRQNHTLENMTVVWLLPIVAAEVTAASGGLLIPHLGSGEQAIQVLFFCYALWAISVLPAMGVLVILFLRMVLHKLPGKDMAVSSWLSLGPIGTGTLGLLLLGADAPLVLRGPSGQAIAGAAQGFGVIGGVILWGYGLYWLVLAILSTLRHLKDGLPFNMGWWGFIFPIGVYSVATLTLARIADVTFYSVAGAVLVMFLAVFWVIVTARTLIGAYHGELFVAPCLSSETGLMDPAACAVQGSAGVLPDLELAGLAGLDEP
ncbi:MAG: TDT family transporter [Steroidobacteraceae bacterium]